MLPLICDERCVGFCRFQWTEQALELLMKVFAISVRTRSETSTYLSETFQMLNLETMIWCEKTHFSNWIWIFLCAVLHEDYCKRSPIVCWIITISCRWLTANRCMYTVMKMALESTGLYDVFPNEILPVALRWAIGWGADLSTRVELFRRMEINNYH